MTIDYTDPATLDAAFAGADVDALVADLAGPAAPAAPGGPADLESARRGRIRRVATEPLVRGPHDRWPDGRDGWSESGPDGRLAEAGDAGASVWSDAG